MHTARPLSVAGCISRSTLHPFQRVSIASVSDEPLQILIFFLTPDPRVETITLSLTFDNVPTRVLAASFDSDPARFASLPKRGNVGMAPPVAED
jgi:hypothetical protein